MILSLVLAAALVSAEASSADPRAIAALERFIAATEKFKSLSYILHKRERMRDGYVVNEAAFVKFRKPNSFYLVALEPRSGQEVIYVGSRDPRRFLVHTGRFPDVTVKIDVEGARAMRRQHHPIYHSAFLYSADVLRRFLAGIGESHGQRLEYGGTVPGGERIIMVVGTRPPTLVKARVDETLFGLVRRAGGDLYRTFLVNPNIEDVSDSLEPGQEYAVPLGYDGTRMEMVVSDTHGLILEHTVTDERGEVYERYVHSDIVVDPPLTDRDFDPDNPSYDF